MASNTYAGLSKDQVFSIERSALINVQEEFVLDKFTDKKTQPQKNGSTLILHYWEHLDESAVQILAEGVPPTDTELVRTTVNGSLQRQAASVGFTDEMMEMHENAGEFHKQSSIELSYVLGRKLEKDAFNIALNGAGTVLPMTSIDADLKLMRNALRTANAPKFTTIKNGSTKVGTKPVNEGWYVFASINDCDLLREAADFLPIEDYGYASDAVTNEIGVIKSLGLRIVETQYINDGSAIGFGEGFIGSLGLGGKNRIEYILKELGSSGTADKANQNGSATVKSRTGFMVIRPEFGVRLQLTAISANAGDDKHSTVNVDVALDGSISDASAGTWTVSHGPDGGTATFADTTNPTSLVQADMVGNYTLRLTPDIGGAVDEMVLVVS